MLALVRSTVVALPAPVLSRVLEAASACLDRQASQISDAGRCQVCWEDVPAHRDLRATRAAQEGKR